MADTLPDDDLSPLYTSTQEQRDAGLWQQYLAKSRRPATVQTVQDVQQLVGTLAPRYGVDPRLVESVIGLESGGNPAAVSPKGAQGVMQLMPGTARRFGVRDPLDAAQNIEGGVRYLAWLRDQFPGRTDLQLAAYHAGEGAVRTAGYAIPRTSDGNMSTQKYVETILQRYRAPMPATPSAVMAGRPATPVPPSTPQPPPGATPVAVLPTPTPSVGSLQTEAALTQQLAGAVPPPGDASQVLHESPVQEPGLVEAQPSRFLGGIAEGAIGTIKSLFQAVVAGEKLVGLKEEGAPDPLRAEVVSQQLDTVMKAVAPVTGEGGRDFVDKLAAGVGSSLISVVPGMAAQRFLQALAGIAPTAARLGGALTSGVIEGAGEAGNLFERTKGLVGEDEAAQRALKSFGTNAVVVTLTDKLGIFGESASVIRRAVSGIVTNGIQEAVQYDIERRQMWVPASHQAAEALKAQGWQQAGDRIIQPFDPKDAAEAAAIGMLVGGPAAAAVAAVTETESAEWDQVRTLETNATGGALHPDFSFQNIVEASQHPEAPPPGIDPETWQRWSTYMLNLVPAARTAGGAGILTGERGALGGGPTIRTGAEGLRTPHYRAPTGEFLKPLRELPTQELELQDMIRQQGGIKLSGEELQGELGAVISRRETGIGGLQNNASGASLQQMAEKADELGFIRTPDKAALLEALDRSVTQQQPVYSAYATGQIPIITDPHVQAGYQAVLDAVSAIGPRTEEQVGGVRHRRDVHADAQALIAEGQWSLDDVREIYPNTTLNDTMASALVHSLNTVGEQMAVAAQQYLENGERLGSREEARLQELMALLAELDPVRLGVSAAQARGLGILNDPLSGYTQFLNNLHRVLETAPERTMGQIARRILAARPAMALTHEQLQANPQLLEQLFAEHYAMVERFRQRDAPFQLQAETPEELLAPPLPTDEAVLAEAAYTPAGPARTPEEWDQVFRQQAQAKLLAAWQAGAFERARAAQALLPDLQALDRQRTEERQRAMQEWSADDRVRDEAYAKARDVWARQAVERAREYWRQGIRDFRAMQAALREGYQPLGLDLPPETVALDRAHREMTQLLLLDENAPAQEALAAYRSANLSTDQQARLLQALRPWETANPQLPLLKALADATKPGFAEYFKELMYNAQLGNPATHLTNMGGNALVAAWAIPERFIAEQYAHGREDRVARGEATAMLYGLVHGIHDAWTVAVRSWQEGAPVSGLGRETSRPPAATAEHMGVDPESRLGRIMDFMFEYIGQPLLPGRAGVVVFPTGGRMATRALMAADEFFKVLAYRMELNALAYRAAVRQGYEGTAFAEQVAQVVGNPQLSDLQQAAHSFSVVQTFQQQLEGRVGTALQTFAEATVRIPGTAQEFPWGRVLIPYIQTPVNIARYSMERMPVLGNFFATYQADIEAGGARADLAHAKITMGTMAMLAFAGLALSGRLTGRGPEDPELRKIWLQSYQPYSVKVPILNKWVSLERFEPISTFAMMIGDMVQIAGEADMDLWQQATLAPLFIFLRNIVSKTYFQGVSNFLEVMSPGYGAKEEQWEAKLARFGVRQGASLLQPSSVLAATARALSPAEVEATNWIHALYARVPGWRDDVPARRTLGGEKVLYGHGFAPDFLLSTVRAYSPLKLADTLIYPADKEILANRMDLPRLSRSLAPKGLAAEQLAQGLPELEFGALGPLRLNDTQYERLAVLAGGNQAEAAKLGIEVPTELLDALVEGLSGPFTGTPPTGTRSLDDFLDWMITQPEYQDASPGSGGGKEGFVKQAISMYRQVGLQLLLAQDDQLRSRYEQSQIEKELQQLPLSERPEALHELQEGYREAVPERREALGLRIGGAR